MSPSERMIRTIRWVCSCCGEVARGSLRPRGCATCGKQADGFEREREAALPSD